MVVATPEGVTLEFTLAGVGSRFVAAILDLLVQIPLAGSILLLAVALEGAIGGWAALLGGVGAFVVIFGYDVAFETLASGRTLGKRWTGLRVVRIGGGPVTFVPSAVRNLLRLIDFLPSVYLAGVVAILATSRNQRLGDLAAGTVVVRERVLPAAGGASWSTAPPTTSAGVARADLATWDVSAVNAHEVAAVREFLDRRASLAPEARSRLARDLAGRLRAKVVGPDDGIGPESFLEALLTAKSDSP